MKKFSALCLFVALVSLTGCGRKKKEQPKPRPATAKEIVEAPATTVAMADANAFYDQDIGAFILEQDMNDNAFDGKLEETLAQADETLYGLEEEPAGTKFKTVYYDFNKYGLRPDQKEVFAYDAQQAKQLTDEGKTIVFEGHADQIGATEYNLVLSQMRASHAADVAAQEYGIDRNAIKVVGRGNSMPAVFVGNDIEEQAPNRRLEIYELTTTL